MIKWSVLGGVVTEVEFHSVLLGEIFITDLCIQMSIIKGYFDIMYNEEQTKRPIRTFPYVNEVTLRGQKPPLKCC